MTEPELISLHRKGKHSLGAASDRKKIIVPTKENPMIVSASELRDFLRCRVKWHFRYQLRLTPVDGAPALALGLLVHEILEAWYGCSYGGRTVARMRKIAKKRVAETTLEELDAEAKELAEAMCIGYAVWAKEEDAAIGLEKCVPEQKFTLPLVPDESILVRGKIDNIFRPRASKRTMAGFEYKTKRQINVDVVEMNLQISVYLWALRRLFPNEKRYTMYYNVLRKQLPGPRVKADLFAREAVERTDEEIEIWAQDTRRMALDMLDAAIYPNATDSCSWDCDFKMPCLTRGNPSDVKHILTTEFKPKEYR